MENIPQDVDFDEIPKSEINPNIDSLPEFDREDLNVEGDSEAPELNELPQKDFSQNDNEQDEDLEDSGEDGLPMDSKERNQIAKIYATAGVETLGLLQAMILGRISGEPSKDFGFSSDEKQTLIKIWQPVIKIMLPEKPSSTGAIIIAATATIGVIAPRVEYAMAKRAEKQEMGEIITPNTPNIERRGGKRAGAGRKPKNIY